MHLGYSDTAIRRAYQIQLYDPDLANKLGKVRKRGRQGTEGRQGTGLWKQIGHNPCVFWLVSYCPLSLDFGD